MFIRILSDLHREMDPVAIPSLPEDKETVLILAGDIDTAQNIANLADFIIDLGKRFKAVIHIAGNHEFYHGTFVDFSRMLTDHLMYSGADNIYHLDNRSVYINGVLFLGSTLWTDFDNENPLIMSMSRRYMNDYNFIHYQSWYKPEDRKMLSPQDVLDKHNASYRFVFETIEEARLRDPELKVVVITHHGPSYLSVAKQYEGNPMNAAFVSQLDDEIVQARPNVWIHGHTHSSFDYNLGQTRVIVNPKGYYDENKKFDLFKRIEI